MRMRQHTVSSTHPSTLCLIQATVDTVLNKHQCTLSLTYSSLQTLFNPHCLNQASLGRHLTHSFFKILSLAWKSLIFLQLLNVMLVRHTPVVGFHRGRPLSNTPYKSPDYTSWTPVPPADSRPL